MLISTGRQPHCFGAAQPSITPVLLPMVERMKGFNMKQIIGGESCPLTQRCL
jgi:hypothetical protein